MDARFPFVSALIAHVLTIICLNTPIIFTLLIKKIILYVFILLYSVETGLHTLSILSLIIDGVCKSVSLFLGEKPEAQNINELTNLQN